MSELEKRLPAAFYATGQGREPVRHWLRGLDIADRKAIGEDIKYLEFAWPVGMPLCGSLKNGLWEVRSSISDGRIARIVFCIHEERMVLLHGFVKKTQKTPARDLTLALERMKSLKRGENG